MSTSKLRGFAAMSKERRTAIAVKGGKASHAAGTAHEFTPDEAKVAGRKGGLKVSRDRKHMSKIGVMGVHARGAAKTDGVDGEAEAENVDE